MLYLTASNNNFDRYTKLYYIPLAKTVLEKKSRKPIN